MVIVGLASDSSRRQSGGTPSQIRRSRLAVKQGRTIDLFFDNEVYVFARAADVGGTTAWNVFAFNVGTSEKAVSFASPFPRGRNQLVTVADARAKAEWTDAKMSLTLPAKSVSAFGFAPE